MDDSQKTDKDIFLPGAIVVAALLIAGALVYNTGSRAIMPAVNQPSSGRGDIVDADDVWLGNTSAPVTIVEFGDYQCPYCGKFFTETESQIREQYIKSGKVKMQFRDFPFLGPESDQSAQAAQCASDQGKFWLYHDALYKEEIADGHEGNGNLSLPKLKSIAQQLGMDAAKFAGCLDSGKYKTEVQNDYDDGVAAGVQGTPAVFINGKLLQGALPYSQFKTAIDEALAKAGSK
jgi:protein-disulfide isomerase